MNGMFKSIYILYAIDPDEACSILYAIDPDEACSMLCAAVLSAEIVATKAVSIISFP